MWTFGHAHTYNDHQLLIDERQQKSNHMYFQPFHHRTLLIGSSRSTYINQHDFTDMDVYNFAVSDMSIREYESFIDSAVKANKEPFETIMIGVDFFKSSLQESAEAKNLDNYLETLHEPFYRYKNLISYDLLMKYAWENYKKSRDNVILEERNYNRDNVAFAKRIDEAALENVVAEKVERFRQFFYGDTYEYNPDYRAIFHQLQVKNPDTDFIIFTTPISTPLFEALVEKGRLPDYERWLRDLVAEFGEVQHFMYPNSVTDDISHYFDGHHFYPEVGTLIANKISGHDGDVPADFGVVLTNENIDEFLNVIREKFSAT